MGLLSFIQRALDNGDYDSVEDYCNENGCNYEDVYDDRDDDNYNRYNRDDD